MNATTRTTAFVAVLFLGLAASTGRAATFTLDLPELTGTFIHGQAAISTNFNIPGLFISAGDMTLSITATGVPGSDLDSNPVPAELLVSVNRKSPEATILSPTAFGPYGLTSSTEEAVFSYDTGISFNTIGVSGEVVIDTNDIFPGVTVAPEVQITAVSLTLDGGLCSTHQFGDISCTGFVGIADLNIVLVAWNTDGAEWPGSDITRDGFVGIEDLNVVLANWNQSVVGIIGPLAAVPEPAALALLGAGVFSLIQIRRRR